MSLFILALTVLVPINGLILVGIIRHRVALEGQRRGLLRILNLIRTRRMRFR